MNTQDNSVFKEVAQILNDNKINYWLCHGTLLGIIRENRLLPWDHDIDFAIWDDEYSKDDILKLFSNEKKFQQIIVVEEMSNLHFLADDKRIDINFYSRTKDIAYIKWIVPGGIVLRSYYFIVNFINSNFSFKHTTEASTKIAKLIKFFIISILVLIKIILPKTIKQKLYKDLQDRVNYTGYSYPLSVMKFKTVNFLDVSVFVPIESEKTLEITYGKDWKVPKQNYVWYKEAKNLLKQ
jgi:phosphorylcholine metabolism protein LicD